MVRHLLECLEGHGGLHRDPQSQRFDVRIQFMLGYHLVDQTEFSGPFGGDAISREEDLLRLRWTDHVEQLLHRADPIAQANTTGRDRKDRVRSRDP